MGECCTTISRSSDKRGDLIGGVMFVICGRRGGWDRVKRSGFDCDEVIVTRLRVLEVLR